MDTLIGFVASLISNIQSEMMAGGAQLFQAMINQGFANHVFFLFFAFEVVWVLVDILLESDLAGGIAEFIRTVILGVLFWSAIQPANYDKLATSIVNASDMIVAQIGTVSPDGGKTTMQILASAIAQGMQLKSVTSPVQQKAQ